MTTPMLKAALRGPSNIPPRVFSIRSEPSLSTFKVLCSQTVTQHDYPLSSEISSNVPIYDLSRFDTSEEDLCARLQDEWHHILLSGPRVVVLQNMYRDRRLIEEAASVYRGIIDSEMQESRKRDHFASSLANNRIWKSFSKHCLSQPQSFVEYYSNPWLALMCEAWLGAAYRITSQVNV
jgi:hypothetical protein